MERMMVAFIALKAQPEKKKIARDLAITTNIRRNSIGQKQVEKQMFTLYFRISSIQNIFFLLDGDFL